jgi:hypothetical protein
MRILNKIAILSLSLGMLFSVSSCFVLLEKKHDNGRHRGHQKSYPRKMKKNQKPIVIIQNGNGHPSKNGRGHGNGHGKGNNRHHGKKK